MSKRWLVTLPVLFIALQVPAVATTERGHGCQLRHSTIVAKTRTAVVFRRRYTGGDLKWPRVYYGCYRPRGAVYRLNMQSEWGGAVLLPITLRGRYAAYVQEFLGPADASQTDYLMAVRDLSNGVVVHRGENFDAVANGPYPTGAFFSVRLKRNGSVAWLAHDGAEYHVRILDSAQPHEPDHGPGIVRSSLRLSHDERSVTWINAGARHSYPIR